MAREEPREGPVVSVIVAVYNGAATLRRCLDSVTNQSYPLKELIVMDGGSTDGTVEILRAYGGQVTHWESEPDRGIYHAWNKGLARASGDWVCFLGADDYFWEADVLTRLAPHLQAAFPGARVVYGQAAMVSKAGNVLRVTGRPWPEASRRFLAEMNIPHPGLMHHRDVFQEHGLFDDSFRLAGDYDLLLRELKTRPAYFAAEVVTVGVQHGGVSTTPSAMARWLEENARVRRNHGLHGSIRWRLSPSHLKTVVSALLFRWGGDAGFRRVADLYRRLTGRPAAWR